MSAATITQPQPGALATEQKVPFGRLVRVEVRKLVDTRAGLWLLIAMAAIITLTMVLFVWNGEPSELTFNNLFLSAVQPIQYLLPLLAAMAITGEWTQRAGLTTFTLEPSRGRLISGKIAGTFVVCLGLVVVMAAVAALANLAAIAIRDGDGSWGLVGSDMRAMFIGIVIFVFFGIAMGMLTLNTPAAIVITLFGPLMGAIIASIPGIKNIREWISLFDAWGNIWENPTGSDWAHLAVAVCVWVGLPLALGVVRVMRSEVK